MEPVAEDKMMCLDLQVPQMVEAGGNANHPTCDVSDAFRARSPGPQHFRAINTALPCEHMTCTGIR